MDIPDALDLDPVLKEILDAEGFDYPQDEEELVTHVRRHYGLNRSPADMTEEEIGQLHPEVQDTVRPIREMLQGYSEAELFRQRHGNIIIQPILYDLLDQYQQRSKDHIALCGQKSHELENLLNELYFDPHLQPATGNGKRIERYNHLDYIVRPEQLPPHDVYFGNAGGCCLGIYDNEVNEMNDAIPFFMLDEATQVFGIYQQRPQSEKRVGMMLAFTCSDEELRPVLLCNSIELSALNNPHHKDDMKAIVDHCVQYLCRQQEVGFAAIAMGAGSLNTANRYTTGFTEPGTTEVLKLPDLQQPPFHNEVFASRFLGQGYGPDPYIARHFNWIIAPE